MLSLVRTAALWGVEAFPVDCEIDVTPPRDLLSVIPREGARLEGIDLYA